MSRKHLTRTPRPAQKTLADDDLKANKKARELGDYVMMVAHNMPKHFRHGLAREMTDSALNVIRYLYKANGTYIGKNNLQTRYPIRRDLQEDARLELRMLTHFAYSAHKQKGIKMSQFRSISNKAVEIDRMIAGWIGSDMKRWFSNLAKNSELNELIEKFPRGEEELPEHLVSMAEMAEDDVAIAEAAAIKALQAEAVARAMAKPNRKPDKNAIIITEEEVADVLKRQPKQSTLF